MTNYKRIINWEKFGDDLMRTYIRRRRKKVCPAIREAARQAGVGSRTFDHVAFGGGCGADAFMRLCLWADLAPNDYLIIDEMSKISDNKKETDNATNR